MQVIIGTKIGMTQIIGDDGMVTPVTILQAGPCTVTQIKTVETDGYNAVQVGYGVGRNLSKSVAGHVKKAGENISPKVLKEFRLEEIPEDMYDNEVRDMLNEFDMRLRQQGMDLGTYLKYTGMDQGAIEATYKPQAEKRVKIRLALEAIARQEKIEVTEEDIENEYKKLADAYSMKPEEVKNFIAAEALGEDIKVEKAMQVVRDNAKVK